LHRSQRGPSGSRCILLRAKTKFDEFFLVSGEQTRPPGARRLLYCSEQEQATGIARSRLQLELRSLRPMR
jgi:hypothetical protein